MATEPQTVTASTHTAKCPSGLKGEIRKPKVREINDMRKGGSTIQAYTKLLRACWTRTIDRGIYSWEGDMNNVPWSEVLSGDRFHLLLRLRVGLYGPMYHFNVPCRSCNQLYPWDINLDEDLIIKPLVDEAKEILKSKEKIFECSTLDGHEIRFRAGTGGLEKMVDDQEEPIIKFVLPRIASLDDQAQPKKIREVLLDMDQDVFDDLRAKMAISECGPDTTITTRCTKCGAPNTSDLPFGPAFFFPKSGG